MRIRTDLDTLFGAYELCMACSGTGWATFIVGGERTKRVCHECQDEIACEPENYVEVDNPLVPHPDDHNFEDHNFDWENDDG